MIVVFLNIALSITVKLREQFFPVCTFGNNLYITRFTVSFCITVLLLAACKPSRHLKPGEKLLYKETVKGTKKLSSSDFTGLYKQKAPKRFLGGLPMVGVYNFGYHFFDTTKVKAKINKVKRKYDGKIAAAKENKSRVERLHKQENRQIGKLKTTLKKGNFIMKMGEAPVAFDTSLMNKTQRFMKYHLISKGFFEGNVTTSIDSSNNRIKVAYTVHEGTEFIIQKLYTKVEDRVVDSLLRANATKAKLKEGKRYDEANLTAERTRITALMKDNGYFDFAPVLVYFNVDTTGVRGSVKLQTVIMNPPNQDKHYAYIIDSVRFYTNENILDSTGRTEDTAAFNGITYIYNEHLEFSKKVADRKLLIRQGNIYKQSSIDQTQKNLSGLDLFQLVTINYDQDTIHHNLTANIHTTTMRQNQIINETGLNVSTQGFIPGPFESVTYRRRNTFKSFELLEINLKAAILGQTAVLNPSSVLKTEQAVAQATLSFPQLYFPGLRGLKWENFSPHTQINTGYTITKRPEYTRGATNLTLSYIIKPDVHRQIIFSPFDVNVINTMQESDTFKTYLQFLQQRGNNLIYSFKSSYVSDMNIAYIYSDFDPSINKKARYVKYSLESGGTFFGLTHTDRFLGLETFRYIKLGLDLRYYYPVTKTSSFAMRYNVGWVNPYAGERVLPYEKYFFAGGPNDIRAWNLRRLGPGSYAERNSEGQIVYGIEQTGELIIETNLEYRFKIMSILEGAFFADAGNIWMVVHDPSRPGADFDASNFLKEIAVGVGPGIRINLTFLIVRFDLGFKTYDPSDHRFVLFEHTLQRSVLNFGIGYPF